MQESKTPVFKYLNLTVFSDGSTCRAPEDPPPVPPSPSPVTRDGDQLLTMDVSLNPRRGTLARLFLPYPPPTKLPVLVYFHGGGFMSMSTTLRLYHSFLSGLARRATVLIVSVDYRLAPEHRLPCAYEDGVDALQWLCEQAKKGQSGEPWLARHAEFSKIFLGGDSSGANIAYNVALRTARIRLGLGSGSGSGSGQYICVRGMMLIHPMFTGETMTESERRYRRRFNYLAKVWEWCLPAGSNRDHPFANPLGGAPSSSSPVWLSSSCQDQVDSSSLSSSSSDASSSLSPLSSSASSSSSSDPSSSSSLSSLSSSTSRSSSSCSSSSSSDNPVESSLPCLSSSSSLWHCLPAALVAVASEDLMTDRAVAVFHALCKAGTQAELFVSQNEDHAFHLYRPASPNIAPLLNQLSSFLNPSLCPRNLSPKL